MGTLWALPGRSQALLGRIGDAPDRLWELLGCPGVPQKGPGSDFGSILTAPRIPRERFCIDFCINFLIDFRRSSHRFCQRVHIGGAGVFGVSSSMLAGWRVLSWSGFPRETFLERLSWTSLPGNAFLERLSWRGLHRETFLERLSWRGFQQRPSWQGFPGETFLERLS